MSSYSEDNDFLTEMGDVKPISQDKIAPVKKLPGDVNTQYRQQVAQSFGAKDHNFLTDGEVEPVDPEDMLSFKVDGVQPAVFKKLRQAKYDIDFHLDLHRHTVAEARQEVYRLLRSADKLNLRTLLITHGKGARSNPPARLKSYVNHWLKQVDIVIGFHSALPRHGGSGSLYVLLKKPSEPNRINQSKYS